MNRREVLAAILALPGVAAVHELTPRARAVVLTTRAEADVGPAESLEIKRKVQGLLAAAGCGHVGVIVTYGVDVATEE